MNDLSFRSLERSCNRNVTIKVRVPDDPDPSDYEQSQTTPIQPFLSGSRGPDSRQKRHVLQSRASISGVGYERKLEMMY
jgi:hypothetical protein